MLADHLSLPFLFDTNMAMANWLWLWQVWLERQLVLKFAQIQLMKRSRVVKLSHSHSLKKPLAVMSVFQSLHVVFGKS